MTGRQTDAEFLEDVRRRAPLHQCDIPHMRVELSRMSLIHNVIADDATITRLLDIIDNLTLRAIAAERRLQMVDIVLHGQASLV